MHRRRATRIVARGLSRQRQDVGNPEAALPRRARLGRLPARSPTCIVCPGENRAGDAIDGIARTHGFYQWMPRISEAKATCSLVGCCSISARPLTPFAAGESGNRRNAVFMMIS